MSDFKLPPSDQEVARQEKEKRKKFLQALTKAQKEVDEEVRKEKKEVVPPTEEETPVTSETVLFVPDGEKTEEEKRMNEQGFYKNAMGSYSVPGWWGISWSSPFRSNGDY